MNFYASFAQFWYERDEDINNKKEIGIFSFSRKIQLKSLPIYRSDLTTTYFKTIIFWISLYRMIFLLNSRHLTLIILLLLLNNIKFSLSCVVINFILRQ
jgi:hypothetical protein